MEQWEYFTLKMELSGFLGGKLDAEEFDRNLNSLGEEGWELVSCFCTNASNGYSRDAVAVLKRRR